MAKKPPIDRFWRQRQKVLYTYVLSLAQDLCKRIPGLSMLKRDPYRAEDAYGVQERFWTIDLSIGHRAIGALYSSIERMGPLNSWLRVKLEGYIIREAYAGSVGVKLCSDPFELDWKQGTADKALQTFQDPAVRKEVVEELEEHLRGNLGPKEWSPRKRN